jgi:shikimate dehydrogenase
MSASSLLPRFAVLGNPIVHSKSPEIHQAFARQFERRIEYTRRLVAIDGFAAELQEMRDANFAGANVTIPFKEQALLAADTSSERAQFAGAANTLTFRADGSLAADNTDGAGLVADLITNLGTSLEGASILLIGAGGAARGVLGPLASLRPSRLLVCNRTLEKADALVARLNVNLASLGMLNPAEAHGLDAHSLSALGVFDLVINSTSASLDGRALDVPTSCFSARTLAYDMVYGKGVTPFLGAARAAGASIADGLGMLVEQAAESFFVWHGQRPNTAPVLAALRSSLPPL